MAELQQININEPTAAEQEAAEKNAAVEEEIANAASAEAEQVEQEAAEESLEGDRPEWLDEKFKSPEDLAKAYKELEKQQSRNAERSKSKGEEEPAPAINDAISKAQEEFAESGELTDKMYVELEKAGIPSAFVDAYIAGQEAMVTSQALDIQQAIGGRENYEAMTDWAQENLNESDIDAYDEIVTSGSVEQAKMAVQGMYARFLSGGGKPPNLTQGSTSGDGVKPFESAAQVTEAMSDPRYSKDPAFRDTVEKRLAASNVF